MKNNKAKTAILNFFTDHPNVRFNCEELMQAFNREGRWLPIAFHTHLSQLVRNGTLERPSRGVYLYRVVNTKTDEIIDKQLSFC